jgi:hypothetical protein
MRFIRAWIWWTGGAWQREWPAKATVYSSWDDNGNLITHKECETESLDMARRIAASIEENQHLPPTP